ncbi:MAG: hypothetical protein AB7I50_26535 [Vicinamibacterales bacterium]
MPRPLTPEQLAALQAVPLGEMPNKVRIALAISGCIQQTEIVAETGLSAAAVSNAATGKGVTTVDTAVAISDFFGCDVKDLFPSRAA